MPNPNDYKYNLFLSWTGADRELKNQIRAFFAEKSGNPKYCYDSDEFCQGWFRENYIEALYQSKVYVLIVSDELLNNDSGRYSEVQRELRNALSLDSEGRLNIIVLNVSPRFKAFKPEKRYDDQKGYFFYSNTQGASNVYAETNADGKISEEKLAELFGKVAYFVQKRDEGEPVHSQHPRTFIHDDANDIKPDPLFTGRKDELKEIKQAFENGAQIVVLSGMGGIGKTRLANQFAVDANTDKTARCLQIVHVQEMLTETNGLRLLVSQTRFVDEFRDSHQKLSEKELFDAKLEALKDVPEYCLLVLDNFNLASEDALYEMVNQLKCRLLVTTRAPIDPDKRQKSVVKIKVGNLAKTDALEMFRGNSGRDVSDEQFESVWTAVKGHTITLCIMASILKKHRGKTVEELVEKINNSALTEIDETIKFSHNESSETKDMLGHLKALFDVSTLSDECKDVLRNMSMLSDGAISIADLQSYMGLKNDNSIVSLIDEGWLEERLLDDGAYVYLHPVISQLIFSIDPPTEDNVAGIINYLAEYYDRQKEALAYSDAHLMVSKLYYAMHKLAASTKRLCMPLWDKYVEINRFLGELDEVDRQRKALNPLLQEEKEQYLVNYFYDFSSLETHPDDFGAVLRQCNQYTVDSSNYKNVLQMISIVGKYAGNEEDLAVLRSIVKMVLPVAYAEKNDLAVLSCIVNLSSKDYSSAKLKSYVRQRKKEGGQEGVLLALSAYDTTIQTFKNLGYSLNLVNVATGGDSKIFKFMLRHPIFILKSIPLSKKSAKISEDDVFKFFWTYCNDMVDSLVDYDEMDVESFMIATIKFVNLLQEEGLTLLKYDEVVDRAISVLKQLPPHMQGQLQQFVNVPLVSADKMTLSDMTRLNVACAVSGFLAESADKEKRGELALQAYVQSQHIVEVQKKLHSHGHYQIVEALLRHGNLCNRQGKFAEARNAYMEAYSALTQGTVGRSSQLWEVCAALLLGAFHLHDARENLDWCAEVKNTGLKAARNNEQKLVMVYNYLMILSSEYQRLLRTDKPNRDTLTKLYHHMVDALSDHFAVVADVKLLEKTLHVHATHNTWKIYNMVRNSGLTRLNLIGRVDIAPFESFFEKMRASSVTTAARFANLYYNKMLFYHNAPADGIPYGVNVVDVWLGRKVTVDEAVTISINLVGSIINKNFHSNNPQTPRITTTETHDEPSGTTLNERLERYQKLREQRRLNKEQGSATLPTPPRPEPVVIKVVSDNALPELLDTIAGKKGKKRDELESAIKEYLEKSDSKIANLTSAMRNYSIGRTRVIESWTKDLKGSKKTRRANYYIQYFKAMNAFLDSANE